MLTENNTRSAKIDDEYQAFLTALGKALSSTRQELGLTQDQLAKKANRKQPAVAKLEGGPMPNLALRVIYEVAQAVPIPLSELFQMAEAQLIGIDSKNNSVDETDFQQAMIEIKKLPPKKQAWIGQIILRILNPSRTGN